MAAKVFQIDYQISTKSKLGTNSLKKYIGKLLDMGKAGRVINNVLTPFIPSTSIEEFLYSKLDFTILTGELLVLVKEDRFPDNELISATSLQKKLRDAIPCLCDKDGNSLELEFLKIKTKKL